MSEARPYRLIVLLNALEGKDAEFTDWFTNTHIPDALKIPGFLSGQFFRLGDTQREGVSCQWQYMASYELDTDSLQGLLDELKRRLGTPLMTGTDTTAPGTYFHIFEPASGVMIKTW